VVLIVVLLLVARLRGTKGLVKDLFKIIVGVGLFMVVVNCLLRAHNTLLLLGSLAAFCIFCVVVNAQRQTGMSLGRMASLLLGVGNRKRQKEYALARQRQDERYALASQRQQ
jgi:hypothetical protein